MLEQAAKAAGEEEKQGGTLSLRVERKHCFLYFFGDSACWFFFKAHLD